MKKSLILVSILTVICFLFMGCSSYTDEIIKQPEDLGDIIDDAVDDEPVTDIGSDPQFEITHNTANVYTDSIGSVWVQVIAEITNTGNAPLYLSGGDVDIETADGSLVSSLSLVSVFPEVILPGEKAYMYEETTLDGDIDVNAEYVAVPRPDADVANIEQILFPVTDVQLKDDEYFGVKVLGRVENTSDEEQEMLYVVAVLFDSADAPIGLIFTILDNVGAGEKVGFEASALAMPDTVTADSIARTEVFAYPLQFQF